MTMTMTMTMKSVYLDTSKNITISKTNILMCNITNNLT